MRRILLLSLLARAAALHGQELPEPFDAGVTYSRTVHVATNGSTNGNGSPEAPFDSIRAALPHAKPGTRILVHAGSYAGAVSLTGLAGEPGHPIALTAEGEVILNAPGVPAILGGSDLRHIVIEGFTLKGATTHGINIDDGGSYDTPADHVILRRLTIAGAGSGGNNDCIKLSGVNDFFVLDSEAWGCNRGEIIDMVGCHNGLIAGNYFHDPIASGVQAKGGSSNILIHANIFADIPARGVNAGGSTDLPFFRPIDAPHEAAAIHVSGNVFIRTGQGAVAYTGCDSCVFAHNTVIEPKTWVARILQENAASRFAPSRNGRFVNNVIVLNRTDIRTFVNVGAGTAPESFEFGSNLWFARDEGVNWTGPVYTGGVPKETGSVIQRDPLFADFRNGDFRLLLHSPARAIGLPGASGNLPDFDGHQWRNPPSAGAFESGAARRQWPAIKIRD